jgi:hypothetical protein
MFSVGRAAFADGAPLMIFVGAVVRLAGLGTCGRVRFLVHSEPTLRGA